MNEFEMNQESFDTTGPKVSNFGLVIKTVIGLIIAFGIAIPNFAQQDLFLGWMYSMNNIFLYFITSLVVTVVLGIIWFTLYRALQTDHGAVFNGIVFIVTSAFAGLFLGNALIFAVYFISYFGDINANDVLTALQITTLATFIAVMGGTMALPFLKMDGMAIKFFRNVAMLLVFLTFASGIVWFIGMIFMLFGSHVILDFLYATIYGLGPVSLFLNVLTIIAAEFMYLIVLARAKYAVGREPKHMENYYAMILVNAIIRIYVEIFKFVLKIIARNND